jgi:hypothetical protein
VPAGLDHPPDRATALLELAEVDAHVLAQALPHVEPLLADPEAAVRAAAGALLARYPLSRPKLREARAVEQDPQVRLVLGLALLLQGDEDAIDAASLAEGLAHAWDADEVNEALAELEQGRAQRLQSMLTDLVSPTRRD